MRLESYLLDIGMFILLPLVLREGGIIFGKKQASIFLWGSILWSGTIENLMVILGGYDYFAYANHYTFGGQVINGYAGWLAFIGVVPLCICIGWFVLSLPAFVISDRLLGKSNIWLKSVFAAVILVSFDMLLDPISVVNEWWRWTSPGFYFRGVTIANYIGWFFLLFWFGAIFERTVIQLKGFRGLHGLEQRIFHTDTSDLAGMDMKRLGWVFYFRLACFFPLFFLSCMIVSMIVLLLFGNNWGPFDSVFPNSLFYTIPVK